MKSILGESGLEMWEGILKPLEEYAFVNGLT